jgi:hypothetical protein
MEWVVRAGEARPQNLISRYTEHLGMRGVFGFSVLHQPGLSWQALLQADGFPNPTVSVADDDDLAAALAPLGYSRRLIKTPGRRYHHTFCVLYDATGTMLDHLPRDAADAISHTFVRYPNPNQTPRP